MALSGWTKTGGDFPNGQYLGRVCWIVDVGNQPKKEGAFMEQVYFGLELHSSGANALVDNKVFSKDFMVGFGDKMKLSSLCKALLCRPLTTDEEQGAFNPTVLFGKVCTVTLEPTVSAKGIAYQDHNYSPLPPGYNPPVQWEQPYLIFDIANPNPQAFNALPEWLQNKIKKATQWPDIQHAVTGGLPNPIQTGNVAMDAPLQVPTESLI